MASIFDSLRGIPIVGDTIDSISGRDGLETAARGAKEAQAQANALAQLQWMRQMQGLQEARGQTQPYLSLYDKIYGTQMAGHVMPVGGIGAGGAGGLAGPGSGPNGNPNPYSGLMRPDGTRGPTERAKPASFGEAVLAAGSKPVYAPITTGHPPASGSAPTPSAYAPPPMATPQNNGNDVLTQYLRSRGAIF